jgi:hypothetical protein
VDECVMEGKGGPYSVTALKVLIYHTVQPKRYTLRVSDVSLFLAIVGNISSRLRLKCDGTRAETIFRLSAKRTSPFKAAGGRQFSRLPAAEVYASAVVMLHTPCSEVV